MMGMDFIMDNNNMGSMMGLDLIMDGKMGKSSFKMGMGKYYPNMDSNKMDGMMGKDLIMRANKKDMMGMDLVMDNNNMGGMMGLDQIMDGRMGKDSFKMGKGTCYLNVDDMMGLGLVMDSKMGKYRAPPSPAAMSRSATRSTMTA